MPEEVATRSGTASPVLIVVARSSHGCAEVGREIGQAGVVDVGRGPEVAGRVPTSEKPW
jgi:hypothetical protein